MSGPYVLTLTSRLDPTNCDVYTRTDEFLGLFSTVDAAKAHATSISEALGRTGIDWELAEEDCRPEDWIGWVWQDVAQPYSGWNPTGSDIVDSYQINAARVDAPPSFHPQDTDRAWVKFAHHCGVVLPPPKVWRSQPPVDDEVPA